MRNARHTAAVLVQRPAHGDGAFRQELQRRRVFADIDAEGFRQAVSSDVIVRRANAAGRENVVMNMTQRVHRLNDLHLIVVHHPRLLQVDA